MEAVLTETAFRCVTFVPEVFCFSIDYGKSLAAMTAAGQYDWADHRITKLFPLEGKGSARFKARYFSFSYDISSGAAVEVIRNGGWECPKTEHILRIGEIYPEEQRKCVIVGLVGATTSVCLSGDDSERKLSLHRFVDRWDAGCRFLAVRPILA